MAPSSDHAFAAPRVAAPWLRRGGHNSDGEFDSNDIEDSGLDSAACVPSQADPCVPDTGVCDGCPATTAVRPCDEPIPWAPAAAENARFDRSASVDCAVSPTTAYGDRHFACADALLVWPYLSGGTAGIWAYGADWLGDLDNDGLADLSFQRLTAYWLVDDSLSAALIYGGRRLSAGDLESQADAVGVLDLVPVTAAGDVDGGGLDDILRAVFIAGESPIFGFGLMSGRSREDGGGLDWPQPAEYWTVEDERRLVTLGLGPAGLAMVDAGDLTGDGVGDLVFSERAEDTHLTQAHTYVLAGGPDLVPTGSAWDAASWRFSERWAADAPAVEVVGRAAGDLDGDGADELGMLDAPRSWPVGGRGWRFGTASLDGLAACTYVVADVIGSSLAVPDATPNDLPLANKAEKFAISRAGDLNGDGLDDVVVVGSVAADDTGQPVLWFLYGGEPWLSAGGNLAGNPDRIEFPVVPASTNVRTPAFDQIARIDLDANAIDDVVIGGMMAESFGRAAWATIIPGVAGGLRGVHAGDDPAFPIVLADDDDYVVPARHSGDLDADGFEDLVLTAMATYDDEPLSVGIFYGGAFP